MIDKLLEEFNAIPKAYNRVAELSGENFNLFRLLRVEYDEVKTHSMFLAELLNPRGTHGQKDIFLKLFVEAMGIKNIDTKTSKVKVEHRIGRKTATDGGRIDIFIQDSVGNCIIIENKIYAGDQENQMLRYANYGKIFKETPQLLYLTLWGKDASGLSTGKKLESIKDYKSISYSKDILLWLQNCRREVSNHPILRECITQYINLLKYLTYQTTNQNMNTEIVNNIFSNQEKLNAYLHLVSNSSVKNAVYKRIYQKLESDLNEIANRLKLQLVFSMDREKLYSGFTFFNEDTERLNLKICYSFLNKYMQRLILGFAYIDPKTPKMSIHQKIAQQFTNKFGSKPPTDWFICYENHKEYENWGPINHERANNGEIAKYIEGELIIMLGIIQNIENE